MRIVLVEFSWQLKEIINNKISYKKDVIVSLDAESSYILKINKIPYFETYEFCNHKELWLKYKQLTDHTINIVKVLDQALWNTDKRFKDLKWKLFNDYHYPLKISFDQLFYYSELILILIKKYNPTEIIIPDAKKILIDDRFLISAKISVFKFLLESIQNTQYKIKISFSLPDQDEKIAFFNKYKFFSIYSNIKGKFKNIYYKIKFLINYYLLKPQYLSINCSEILRYKNLYPNESRKFLSYQHKNLNKKKFINHVIFFRRFIDHLENKTNFYELIKNNNISFKKIFDEILLELIMQLDFMLKEYSKAKKIIIRTKPKCLIFQTMTPFYSANITFRKSCIDFKIPFVTWAHGGYGLNYSMQGYDVTDYRFCKNHISWGIFMSDLVENNDCILKQMKFYGDYKFFPVGSPKLDYNFKKRNLKKVLKAKDKRTVIFFTGGFFKKNHFSFGRNRQKMETSLWEFHYKILCLLKKYQNKYNIIIKDYPVENLESLWKKVLKDINADKILYVSDKYKVNDLLNVSDLNIMPWVGTIFFESLYFDADIFAIEEDASKDILESNLKDEIFYFNNENFFLVHLQKYLDDGIFYTRDKKKSKNYFLTFDTLNKRNDLLNHSLSKIKIK